MHHNHNHNHNHNQNHQQRKRIDTNDLYRQNANTNDSDVRGRPIHRGLFHLDPLCNTQQRMSGNVEAFQQQHRTALALISEASSSSSSSSSSDPMGNIINSVQFLVSTVANTANSLSTATSSPMPSPPPVLEVAYDGERGSFPLQSIHSTQYVKERVALIGDAAHTIHPLAGQGVNIGLADVAALTRTLMLAGESGTDLGATHLLREYEKERSTQNKMVMGLMDAVYRTFTLDVSAWHMTRSLGMNVIDSVAPVKNKMAEFAMGKNVDMSGVGRPGFKE
eukprot:gb/GECH01007143.1/.p1 GENE.gb/GECH01007143.1/~~gb/GECH01007143.1/.p1  ORF type:complete len:279 (+),score=61.25 gb/GECH01007143.1/:1-837(+)